MKATHPQDTRQQTHLDVLGLLHPPNSPCRQLANLHKTQKTQKKTETLHETARGNDCKLQNEQGNTTCDAQTDANTPYAAQLGN